MKQFFDPQQRLSVQSGRVFFKWLGYVLLVAILFAAALPILSVSAQPAQQTTNLALARPVVCSSIEFPCAEAVDGNTGTRWASAQGVDPQWIYVDLGASYTISRVVLTWEAAYGKSYQIQVSADAANWTAIYTTTTGDGGIDDLIGLSGSGRYIRMNGTARGTGYGYSLWEFQVYGGSGGATATRTPMQTLGASNTPAVTVTRTLTLAGPTNTLTRTKTPGVATSTVTPAGCGATNVALNKATTSSSNENAGTMPNLAVDGNTATRWASAASDPQWIQIDLGATYSICRVRLTWETAYASAYMIQLSPDAAAWTTIYSTAASDGNVDDLTVTALSGRYIRMYGTTRATGYGYSLWEFEVYTGNNGPTATVTPTLSRTVTPSLTSVLTATRTVTAGVTPTSGACRTSNMALNRPAASSSNENVGATPNLAVDGNAATRWSSLAVDPQWLQVDLGSIQDVCHIKLSWEAAYGKAYQIQLSNDAIAWNTIYATTTGDGGVDDLTGLAGSGRYIRIYGTVRGTVYGYSLWEFEVYISGGQPTLTPAPTSTPPGGQAFWGDTSNIPVAQNVLTLKFLNRTNGKYPDSQVYWSFNGQVHSIAEQPTFDMPANSAGRMYFYLGSPTSEYNDFIEFTIGPAVFNGNTTRVDWFGLKLAMRLHAADGYDAAVGEDLTTFQEDRAVTFQKFINEVPAEFKHLAQIQAPYRIPAPGKMGEADFLPTGQYANYYTSYAASVGVNASIFDILACAGSLANEPGMCSALNRHVAHLPQSQWSTSSLYYQAAPANYYSKFWHDHSLDALSYGFPYDDFAGYSSFIAHDNPQWLLVAIGW